MALNSFAVALVVGLLCGIISGYGIGGGSLLMVWLTAVLSLKQHNAQALNLLYFIPTAFTSLFLHKKNELLSWNVIIPAAIAGCVSAFLFSKISIMINAFYLRKVFAVFLIITGILELKKGNRR